MLGAAILVLAVTAGAQERAAPPEAPRGRVLLNLAAHPDDEDGAALAYYGRKHGVRTAIIVATRGEGGQNATGEEMGVELGALRTLEMAGAARALEADLYFLNLPDFGFSKTAEETLGVWGKDVALERLVRLIREIGPDVIFTNHDPERGHGHHRALATLALEAFRLAPDPAAYPEHADAGIRHHQPQRLFFRTNGPGEGSLAVPVGEPDPDSGKTYRELALAALRLHGSQGPMKGLPWGGEGRMQHYLPVASVGPLPEGGGVGLFAGLGERPKWAEAYWETEEASVLIERGGPALLGEAAARLASAAETPGIDPGRARWLRQHSEVLEGALWRSLDILSDVQVRPRRVAPGEKAKATLVLEIAGARSIEIHSIRFSAETVTLEASRDQALHPGEPFTSVGNGERFTSIGEISIPADFVPTLPLPGTLSERDRVGRLVEVELHYRALGRALVHRWSADLEVSPPFSVSAEPAHRVLPRAAPGMKRTLQVRVTNRTGHEAVGRIGLRAPLGFRGEGARQVPLPAGESVHTFEFRTVTRPPLGVYPFGVVLQVGTGTWSMGFSVTIGDVRIDREMDVLVLEGADTTIQDFLSDLGVDRVETDADPDSLDLFDAIAVGVRACATRGDMKRFDEPLRRYVRDGGHLVVLYHKSSEWDGQAPFAPYPLPLSRDRVTREDSEAVIIRRDHAILRVPNAIGRRDWKGWVQERGLYFPRGYSDEYEEVVSFADPQEEPLRGGLLFARHGKGTYIYTSLVWHRQIRAGHGGAARLLANILSPR